MRNRKKVLTAISGATLLFAVFLNWFFDAVELAKVFYFTSIFTGGYYVFLSAFKGLFKQRFLNIYFLVIIATIGAVYINQLVEAAAVVFFFSLAEFFEEFGIERSRRALEVLIKKSPQSAILKNGKKVSVEKVKVDDIVIVRPGYLIPLDGIVVKGSSSVDEASITGESIPKDKRKGDSVFAGTVNQQGYLEIKVTKESKNSTFSKIIKLVEKAQKSRAPTQEFIDRFAKYYTPAVVSGAVLIVVVPYLFIGGNFNSWLNQALVLLVIACPCALVISTPISIASAIGGASRHGVLIKGGKYLEMLGKIKAVAFDKTKTLTLGKPYVSEVVAFNNFSEEEVLADAAGIEKFSSHPLSKSILDFIQKRKITPHTMEKYQYIAGKGGKAACLICNTIDHCIGNLKLIGANSKTTKDVLKKVEELEKEGKTVVLLSEGNKVAGILAIADKIRPESKETIRKLNHLGVETIMLTGDNKHTADFVARQLKIRNFYASLLPDEKVQKLDELKKKYGLVAMVGDGVNDAPSLATATIGIAMGGGGSDAAIEASDIALMNNNLLSTPYAVSLGRKTLRTIKQNIAVSLAVKAFFLVLAVFGFTHLEFAIGADSGVAILVILNSLRLFHFK